MAQKERSARKPERDEEQDTDRDMSENGREEDVAKYEQELAGYLQDRIKPGLNRGSIPLLARSIAKEIARDEYADRGTAGREPSDDEDDDELTGDGEPDGDIDLETALHELQSELGEDWILYFSVQGENTWLTAEKDDASQRVEAPSASVLTNAVKVLNEGGGRPAPKQRD
jgi:hypothetical protein